MADREDITQSSSQHTSQQDRHKAPADILADRIEAAADERAHSHQYHPVYRTLARLTRGDALSASDTPTGPIRVAIICTRADAEPATRAMELYSANSAYLQFVYPTTSGHRRGDKRLAVFQALDRAAHARAAVCYVADLSDLRKVPLTPASADEIASLLGALADYAEQRELVIMVALAPYEPTPQGSWADRRVFVTRATAIGAAATNGGDEPQAEGVRHNG